MLSYNSHPVSPNVNILYTIIKTRKVILVDYYELKKEEESFP